jgi:hypothetical protein
MWPELSLEAALLWTARAAAWAAVVDTTELLVLRRNFGPGGIWEPELLAEDWRAFSRPMQVILHFFLARGFVPLLVLRLGLALALLGSGYLPLALPLLLGAVLTSLRFRGSYNGGSDSMMVVLWFGLGLASHCGPTATVARRSAWATSRCRRASPTSSRAWSKRRSPAGGRAWS